MRSDCVAIAAMLLPCIATVGCVGDPVPSRPAMEQLIAEALMENQLHPNGYIENENSLESMRAESVWDGEAPNGPFGDDDVEGRVELETLPAPQHDGHFGDDEFTSDEPRMTEEFVETDLREAILLLAAEAGAEVVLDEQVRGVVNTSIEEATFEAALSKILLPLGFVYAAHDDGYVVAPADPESPLFHLVAEQAEYRPRHISPEALLETTPRRMRDFVQVVKDSNSLLIDAPRSYANLLLTRFQKLDQPVPQVLLEAIICVVEPDCGFRFGANWGHAVELDGKTALDLGVTGLAIDGEISPAGLEAVFKDFATTSAFIKRLAENGYLTIRAAPRVMAEDGEQANIAINRETFFSVQPVSSDDNAASNAFFFQQEIQKVESGITLAITPQIRGDVVTVNIEKAEVSEDIRNANTELALNPFPIINRRSVSTTVHVEDGHTIVIGGLIARETVDRTNRVPGLSEAPVLGHFFKNTQQQTREVEVVIFISPKIVLPTDAYAAAPPYCDKPICSTPVQMR